MNITYVIRIVNLNNNSSITEYFDTPILSGALKYSLIDNEIYYRLSYDGDIILYGETNINNLRSAIINNYSFLIDIYFDSSLIYIGLLDINGEFDYDKFTFKSRLITYDKYYNLIQNYNKDFNILDTANVPEIWKIYTTYDTKSRIVFNVDSPFGDGVGSAWGTPIAIDDTYPPTTFIQLYAREELELIDNINASQFVGSDGWTLKTGTTNVIIRDWTYSYSDSISQFYIFPKYETSDMFEYPLISQGENDYINEQLLYIAPNIDNRNITELSNYTIVYNSGILLPTSMRAVIYANVDLYPSNKIFYTRARKLFDIIENLVTLYGYTINENTFAYFESKEKFQNLLVESISDAILDGFNNEKPFPTVLCNVTFKRITDYLKEKFNIYYYITDDNVIIFLHWTSRFTGLIAIGMNDLTTWQGINFCKNKNVITYDNNEKFNIIKRLNTGFYLDFVGKDILFSQVRIDNKKELSNEYMYIDIYDSLANKSKYPQNETNLMLFSCNSNTEINLLQYFRNGQLDGDLRFFKINNEEGIKHVYPDENQNFIFTSEPISAGATSRMLSNTMNFVPNETLNLTIKSTWNYYPAAYNIKLIKNWENWLTYEIIYQEDITTNDYTLNYTFTEYTENVMLLILSNYFNNSPAYYLINFTEINITSNKLFIIREAAGILNTITLPNMELSQSYCDNEEYAGAYDINANINGVDVELSESQLLKIKTQTIQTVSNNFVNDFDPEMYIKTELTENGELKEIVQPLDKSPINLILKY